MKRIVDKIRDCAVDLMAEYILRTAKDIKKNDLWKKAIKKACEATEGIDNSFTNYIIKSSAIQRHFERLIKNKMSDDDVYRSFILTIAVELSKFYDEKGFALSLGMAILDNWFELNGENYPDARNQDNFLHSIQTN